MQPFREQRHPMPEPSRPPVDLNDLRIKEHSDSRSGLLVWVLLILFVPAAFAGGWFLRDRRGGEGGPAATPVAIHVVEGETEGGGARTGEFTEGGWVEVPSYHPIVVSALMPGRVEELRVVEGARVAKDDILATLYSRDLEDAVRLAEAEVARAEAELDLLRAGYRKEEIAKAAADVARAGEDVSLAEKVWTRTQGLVPDGVASEEEADRDAAALAVARARLTVAREEHARLAAGFRKEEVAKAAAELESRRAALSLARLRLSFAVVPSPADGVVFERFVTPGSNLTAGDPRIVSLYDPEDLQVRVDVRLENLSRIQVGMRAKISTDAEPDRTYPGTVIRFEPMADFRKNTVQAKIRIDEPGSGLHPEMICRVRFGGDAAPAPAGGRKIKIRVPASAVREADGKTFVFKLRDGRANRTEIVLGERAGGLVVVERGVAEGDRVILAPSAELGDQDAVREVAR